MSFDIHSILTNLSTIPEPGPLSLPYIVYASDVKHPRFREKIAGIKVPVYWTTSAVMALIERGEKP